MLVYWLVLGLCSACALFCRGKLSLRVKCGKLSLLVTSKIYWCCAIILIFLSGVRSVNVGADTLNYCYGFKYIRQLSFKAAMQFGWENGYVALNWLLGRFFKDDSEFLICMAILILLPIFIWIKRESRWALLSLVVFVGMGMWNSSMFILRQWCAMAILTFSYKYARERKFIPFLILVLVAMMFHRTAAVFILVYFVLRIPLNKWVIVFAAPASVIVGLLGGRILSFLNRFARIGEAGNFNGGVSMLIVLWLCVIAALICFKGSIPNRLDFYYRIVFLAAFLQPIAFTFSNWARIVSYFSISLSVFIPNFIVELTLGKMRNGRLRPLLGVTVCVLMVVWFKMLNAEPYVFR